MRPGGAASVRESACFAIVDRDKWPASAPSRPASPWQAPGSDLDSTCRVLARAADEDEEVGEEDEDDEEEDEDDEDFDDDDD